MLSKVLPRTQQTGRHLNFLDSGKEIFFVYSSEINLQGEKKVTLSGTGRAA